MHRTKTGCLTFIFYAEVSLRTEWEHHSFTAEEFLSSIPSPRKERIAASVTRGKERFPQSNRWTDTVHPYGTTMAAASGIGMTPTKSATSAAGRKPIKCS